MTDKEKTIKELKEALDSLDITNKYRLNLIRAIEYLQEETVSEELKEIAWNYADKRCLLDVAVFTPDEVKKERGKMQFTWHDLYDAVMFGANWQKEQMMAKAVDVDVVVDRIGEVVYLCQHKKEKTGDKVKVIVIKED